MPWNPGERCPPHPARRCRACSLRLTTSPGLPEAEPRDPAATPLPSSPLSTTPRLAQAPALARRAGTKGCGQLPPRACQPHARLSRCPVLPLPVPASPLRGWGRHGAAGCPPVGWRVLVPAVQHSVPISQDKAPLAHAGPGSGSALQRAQHAQPCPGHQQGLPGALCPPPRLWHRLWHPGCPDQGPQRPETPLTLHQESKGASRAGCHGGEHGGDSGSAVCCQPRVTPV